MVEVKPIVVMYFPADFSWQPDGRVLQPLDLMRELNGWSQEVVRPKDGFEGYIWFAFTKEGIDAPALVVYNSKDATPIKIEELKQLVLRSIENQKIKP